MTAKDIIRDYLKEHGFDGLCCTHCDPCGCGLDDLAPCGNDGILDCEPAYKRPCKGEEGGDCFTTERPKAQPAPAEQGEGLVCPRCKGDGQFYYGDPESPEVAQCEECEGTGRLLASRPQHEDPLGFDALRQDIDERGEFRPQSEQAKDAQELAVLINETVHYDKTFPDLECWSIDVVKTETLIEASFQARLASAREQGEATMDAKRCAVLAWRSNDRPGGMDWIDTAAIVIENFAKRYAERKVEEMRAALDEAEGPLTQYVIQHPKWTPLNGVEQDPYGSHKALEMLRAALAPSAEGKEKA
jgi:hypothetical protein